MKAISLFILSLYANHLFAARNVTLPTDGSVELGPLVLVLQLIINFVTGPYSLFLAIIFFVTFIVVWLLKPMGGFLGEFMKWGFGILAIIFGIGVIVNLFNSSGV